MYIQIWRLVHFQDSLKIKNLTTPCLVARTIGTTQLLQWEDTKTITSAEI